MGKCQHWQCHQTQERKKQGLSCSKTISSTASRASNAKVESKQLQICVFKTTQLMFKVYPQSWTPQPPPPGGARRNPIWDTSERCSHPLWTVHGPRREEPPDRGDRPAPRATLGRPPVTRTQHVQFPCRSALEPEPPKPGPLRSHEGPRHSFSGALAGLPALVSSPASVPGKEFIQPRQTRAHGLHSSQTLQPNYVTLRYYGFPPPSDKPATMFLRKHFLYSKG